MKVKKFDYENASNLLKKYVNSNKEDVRMYTVCDHVSKSGMRRNIKLLLVKNDEILLLGYGWVSGCGMDMGYHIAETAFYGAFSESKNQFRTFKFKHSWI